MLAFLAAQGSLISYRTADANVYAVGGRTFVMHLENILDRVG